MSHAIPYREDSRTLPAFVLSALLHGLLAGALVAFFIFHHSPPVTTTSHTLELVGPESPNAADGDSAAGSQTATVSTFGNVTSLTVPQPPTPTQVQVQDTQPQDVSSSPPQPVSPTPDVVKPSPKTPTPRGATTRANTTPTTMTHAQWLKLHPQTVPTPNRGATTATSKPVPNVGIHAGGILQNLENLAKGSGTGQRNGHSNGVSAGGSAGTSDDYDARLVVRVQEAFSVPPALSGYSAGIHLVIDAHGNVIGKKLIRSSGNDVFDAAVNQALARLTNVDPPPSGEQIQRDVTLVPKEL